MPTPFELDQVTVRARSDSQLTRSRNYDLLDPTGAALGTATQDTGLAATARRQVASARGLGPAAFDLRDQSGALLAHLDKQVSGLLRRRIRTEISLADATVVAVAAASPGSDRVEVTNPSGAAVVRLARAGRTFLAGTGPHGEPYAAVDLEANTRTAQQAGTAHANSYLIRFDPAAPMLVRIATVAVVIVFDSQRGG